MEETLKYRFLVFHYDTYYPLGGMKDCRGKFAIFEEALDHLRNLQISGYYLGHTLSDVEKANDWDGRHGHIYNVVTGEITNGRNITFE